MTEQIKPQRIQRKRVKGFDMPLNTAYIIKDTSPAGFLMFSTLRTNRKDCWLAFCAPEHKEKFKAMGFACVKVEIKEVTR
jgi:hypothetical protein